MPAVDGEHPIVIPRPQGARPGAPAPWADSSPPSSALEIVEALGDYTPPVPDASIITPIMREAAVLIPVVDRSEGPEIVVIKRPGHMPSHRGELAFPGGGRSERDKDLWATALREANEEIGLDSGDVEYLAELDTMVTVGSRYILTPFVGVVHGSAKIRDSSAEADRVLSVPVARLFEPGVFAEEVWPWPSGEERPICFFHLDDEDIIWGATGRILSNLLGLVSRVIG